MKPITRDDTEHGVLYYKASEVDAVLAQAAQPAQADIAAAWVAGYYHAGYTNDGAYADKMSNEFATQWVAQPAQLPAGYVLVPVEPTLEMIKAGAAVVHRIDDCNADDEPYRARGQAMHAYMDMVAAAPVPDTSQKEQSND